MGLIRLLAGISNIHFPPTQKILLTAAQCHCESSLQCKVLSRATEGAIGASRENLKGRNRPSFDPCFRRGASCQGPTSSLDRRVFPEPAAEGQSCRSGAKSSTTRRPVCAKWPSTCRGPR